MEYLNSKKIYYAFVSGANKVISCRRLLNKINVFPVADGDTGNNLAATMNSIINEAEVYDSVKDTLESLADAALLGAKGNSGIIFAQFINGLSINLEEKKQLSVDSFAEIIKNSVPHVYNSVSEPVEGTMLTVIKDWAVEIDKIKKDCDDFRQLFKNSLVKINQSLDETTNQLEVLKEAEVVDAGAKGFVKFIEGILEFISSGKIDSEVSKKDKKLGFLSEDIKGYQNSDYRYCTEALLRELTITETEVKKLLSDLGDSLIIASNSKRTKIHIHTSQPAEVFDRLRNCSQLEKQKADDMYKQYVTTNKRKFDIALLTDSIADLPQELLDKYQVHVINLNLLIEGSTYLDKLTITPDKFYSLLDEVTEHPTSSQPSLKQVEDLFSFLTEHYQSVLTLTVSKELSGTWNIVEQVAEQFRQQGEKISVLNSKLNSGAQGLLVLEAAEQIAQGKSHVEIVEYLEDVITRSKIYVSVNTLKYMVRGGRISSFKGFIAKILNLKPIVSLDEQGAGVAFDKAFSKRGTTKKIKELVEQISKEQGIKRYSIVYAQNLARAKEYKKIFSSILGQEPEYLAEISPIVGLNAGIGAVAISLIAKSNY